MHKLLMIVVLSMPLLGCESAQEIAAREAAEQARVAAAFELRVPLVGRCAWKRRLRAMPGKAIGDDAGESDRTATGGSGMVAGRVIGALIRSFNFGDVVQL
jgi:hypothetical protein